MELYCAPMEGLTDVIFRKVHSEYYGNLNKYYIPFFSPTMHRSITPKEQQELPLADSLNYVAVPQIMTKCAEDFIWAAEQCAQRGYEEVNLNAGCPSGTVFSKGKGAGMLADPDGLKRFLDAVCSRSPLPVSVKTRIGVASSDEFYQLLDVYNLYPISKLIVHPRVRSQYYKGNVDKDIFSYGAQYSKNPICYNGDITNLTALKEIQLLYPALDSVMIGRGLIRYPGLLAEDKDVSKLESYHNTLLNTYIDAFRNAKNAMFRMKEHWFYLLPAFSGSEKLGKRIRKAATIEEYRCSVNEVFQTLPYCPD